MEKNLEMFSSKEFNLKNHIEKYNLLKDVIIKAVEEASGRTNNIEKPHQVRKNKRKNPVEWWDEDCKEIIKARKEKLRKFKEIKELQDYIEFKKARAMATKTIKQKKRENFKRFIESINKYTNISYIWKKMRVLKKSSKTVEWTKWQKKDRNQECIKVMNELSPPWVQERRIYIEEREADKNESLNDDIKKEEVIRAINCCKKNSAPGLDGIEYEMFKKLPKGYINILTDIFNQIFKKAVLPEQWRKYQVIFIDKPGKEKVRPISLSSCMGKILERIVTERLNWWAESRGKINNYQNGFRRGKSCMENLAQLVTDVKVGRCSNTDTMTAFLDVSSVYDNVLYNPLIYKLIQEDCPVALIKYIESWMSSRRVKFILDKEKTETRNVFKGLPQGAVMSPILYDL